MRVFFYLKMRIQFYRFRRRNQCIRMERNMNEITNSVTVDNDIRWIFFNELAFNGVDHVLNWLGVSNVVKLTGWRKRNNTTRNSIRKYHFYNAYLKKPISPLKIKKGCRKPQQPFIEKI